MSQPKSNLKSNPFAPAKKEAVKLRMAIMGASGSGKTWTALLIAERLCELQGGKIAFLDTEGRSASLYADRFSFDVYDLSKDYNPERYIAGIHAAEQFGYTVIVIDSFSHAWSGRGGVLDIVDEAGKKMGGNKFAGWSKGRPAHNDLVDTIINSDIHIIGTMRSKTDWVLETDERTGKAKPVKKGLAAVQSADFEYEFDVVVHLDMAHTLTISKSRCHSLQAETRFEDVIQVAMTLNDWMTDGETVTHPEPDIAFVPTDKPDVIIENGAEADSDPPPEDEPASAEQNGDSAVRANEVYEEYLATMFANRVGYNGYLIEYGPDSQKPVFTWDGTATNIASLIFMHRCQLIFGYTLPEVCDILDTASLKAYLKVEGNDFASAWDAVQTHHMATAHEVPDAPDEELTLPDLPPPPPADEPPSDFKGAGGRKIKAAWEKLSDDQRHHTGGEKSFKDKAIALLKENAALSADKLRDAVMAEIEAEAEALKPTG